MTTGAEAAWVDIYWLPLGAGGHCVRLNGQVYEWLASRRAGRPARELFHSALLIRLDGVTWSVEMGPVWNIDAPADAAVCTGPVGARPLGRFRLFRYEVRCWAGGYIPDLAEAVDSPTRLSDDHASAGATLDGVRRVPALTWGRDEQRTGEMWNSNSVISWALATSGHDLSGVLPPRGGRAPGWDAGLVLADRAAQVGSARVLGSSGAGRVRPPASGSVPPARSRASSSSTRRSCASSSSRARRGLQRPASTKTNGRKTS